MNYSFNITYLTCQSCTAKIHCENCAAELQEKLQQHNDIHVDKIDIPARSLRLQTQVLDEDDLLDLLEDAGIFAD